MEFYVSFQLFVSVCLIVCWSECVCRIVFASRLRSVSVKRIC